MQIIDSTTIRVDSFGELSATLTANNSYTYIYLGDDIVMTSGIQINNSRTLLVIDGEYPQGSGIYHTLQDTGGDFGMIYKSNISSLDITLQNMTIAGRNFYGMPRIADGNTDVTVTYRNITYTGPQITWHWSGLTRYIDCDITIQGAGYSARQEIAEICQVEIGGKTTIQHTTPGTYACFNFYKTNASFTILEDAVVDISTANDFLYHSYPPTFVIEPRASFTLTTQKGFTRSSAYRMASFLVDENATFRYIQLSDSAADSSVYIDGAFTVNSGASVYMQADFQSSYTNRRLLRFTANSSARGMYVNNPKSFVLYTRGPGAAMYFSAATPFVFTGNQVNYWQNAGALPAAGTFAVMPYRQWLKADYGSLEIRGSAATSSTTVASTTLPTPVIPDIADLKLHEARALSIGDLPLDVDAIVDDQSPVSGKTDPFANIMVVYTDDDGIHTFLGTADENGGFSVSTLAPIPLDTEVAVSANVPFLYRTVTEKTRVAGELYIESAPTLIKFSVPSLTPSPRCILGRTSNVPVVVKDTRVHRSEWELTASVDSRMHCEHPGCELPGDVVFVPVNATFDDEEPFVPTMPKRVYVGGPDLVTTDVKWNDNVGILLHITGAIRLGNSYKANLNWVVTPIEP